jgi:Ni/Fe-hydrogenase subunit HybB-like protein
VSAGLGVIGRPGLGHELRGFGRFVAGELRPRGRIATPFNVITATIMAATVAILVVRFANGLGAVTHLSQQVPWGLWIGFDVVTGVAFAGGAYVVAFLVHILNVEKYRPILRVTVLNGFLAYAFYTGALLLDLGRPWNVINPIIGNSFGVSSVMFLVAWHFLLYLLVLFFEFSPAAAEWLGWERVRRVVTAMTLGAVIFGITLSVLHQAGLGALYLLARDKIHPLWYSEFLPLLFLVSSVFAGLAMVILEGSITHRVFHHRVGPVLRATNDDIVFGLARISAAVMFAYLFMQIMVFVHGHRAAYLGTGWGAWYLVELLPCTALPAVLYAWACQRRSVAAARIAAVLTIAGILLNRLNVSIIAYNWNAAVRYTPSWMEVVVTAGVISAELWVFRWIVQRMRVLGGSVDASSSVGLPAARIAAQPAR